MTPCLGIQIYGDVVLVCAELKRGVKMTEVQSNLKANAAAPSQIEWNLPGFGPMTRISTSFGEVHAQALRERDVIRTPQGVLKPIKWVDRMRLDAAFMRHAPDAQAVMIRAGALGGGLPKADIVVSPEQLIGIGRHAHDVKFTKAKKLLGRPGVIRKPEEMMTYTLFHCGETAVVRVEGIWAEVSP